MSSHSGADAFWMNGILASDVEEISHDPVSLNKDGFWAVQVNYEGEWTLVRYRQRDRSPYPKSTWMGAQGVWESSLDRSAYIRYVEEIRNAISQGLVYQANACRILRTVHGYSLTGLFYEILQRNPAPHAAYFSTSDIEIASASPELFLSLRSDDDGVHFLSRPIKGTATTPYFGEKDRSENIMIVDLMRNDLSQIARPGSVCVPRFLEVEEHPGLFHLVSDISGILRDTFDWREFGKALLPAGSISGAPKKTATQIIAQHEGKRGPYCGILGWVERRGDQLNGELSVAIRTFWREKDLLSFGTGAGITWGSDPIDEWHETELKASRLIHIASGTLK